MRNSNHSFGCEAPLALSSDDDRMKSKNAWPLVAIVDDDLSVCRALKRLLTTHRIKAETFTSSRIFMEIVEALPSFEPECVVLDMHMPGLDGLAVCRRLARVRPHIPVMFLTSTHDPALYKEALALGAVAFFQKPFRDDLDSFVVALRALLNLDYPDHT
jgi:FixJ family two-component response regulator